MMASTPTGARSKQCSTHTHALHAHMSQHHRWKLGMHTITGICAVCSAAGACTRRVRCNMRRLSNASMGGQRLWRLSHLSSMSLASTGGTRSDAVRSESKRSSTRSAVRRAVVSNCQQADKKFDNTLRQVATQVH